MTFLSASSTPEFQQGSHLSYYTFKERCGVSATFKQGNPIGELSLRHFCLLKACKRKSSGTTKSSKATKRKSRGNQQLYSARLYRNIQEIGQVSAVFCVCLFSPVYMQHCDNVIAQQYTGMSEKGEGRSDVYAQIVEDKVTVHSTKKSGYKIGFDKIPTLILKRDIHIPEKMDMELSQFLDYPPRLLIYVEQTHSSTDPAAVKIVGLDRECTFTLQQPILMTSLQVVGSTVSRYSVSMPEVKLESNGEYYQSTCDFSAYVSSLPPHARPHLEVQLDWDQDIVEIAHHMLGWEEKLCSHLGLTEVDVHDIKAVHGSKPELQRREALRRWRSNQGLGANFGNLLQLFVNAGHSMCAAAVCDLLKRKYPTTSRSKSAFFRPPESIIQRTSNQHHHCSYSPPYVADVL